MWQRGANTRVRAAGRLVPCGCLLMRGGELLRLTYRELPHTVRTLTAHTKFETEPFYLNVAEIDPQKRWNATSDFRFANVATSAGRVQE